MPPPRNPDDPDPAAGRGADFGKTNYGQNALPPSDKSTPGHRSTPRPPSPAGEPAGDCGGNAPAPSKPEIDLDEGEVIYSTGDGAVEVRKVAREQGKRFEARKVIRTVSAEAVAQCLQELRSQAQLTHHNIIHVYDWGTKADYFYIVMEYATEGTLQKYVGKHGKLEPRVAAAVLETVAKAAHFAHERGIIHRDLKPSNILLQRGNTPDSVPLRGRVPKLADFGIAIAQKQAHGRKETGPVGTPGYMAPEQCVARGEVTARTDVYGLGAVLYYLLAGRAPFGDERKTTEEVLRDIESPVVMASPLADLRPGLPRDLVAICERCLAKSPAQRYPDAKALADDCQAFLDGRETTARRWTGWERARDWVRHHGWWVLFVAVVVLGVAGFIGYHLIRPPHDTVVVANYLQGLDLLKEVEAACQRLQATRGRAAEQVAKEALEKACRETTSKALVLFSPDAPESSRKNAADECAKLGESLDQLGYRKQALEAYDKAASLYDSLAATYGKGKEPTPEGLRSCEIRRKCGWIFLQLSEYAAAEQCIREALQRTAWVEGIPLARGMEGWAACRAEAYHLEGEWHGAKANRDRAIQSFDGSIAWCAKLVKLAAREPRYRRDLARGYGYLGDVYLENHEFVKALQAYQRAETERRWLVEHATKGKDDHEQQLARSRANEGYYWLHRGDPDKAALAYDDARRKQLGILARSNHAEVRDDCGWCSTRLAELLIERPEMRTAWTLELVRQAVEIYDDLVRMNPDSPTYRISQARSRLNLGKFYLRRSAPDDLPTGRPHVQQADDLLATVMGWLKNEPAGNSSARRDSFYYRALTLTLLAEVDGADADAPRLEDAVFYLRSAIATGYRNAAELRRETALQYLRTKRRPAFDNLVSQIDARKE